MKDIQTKIENAIPADKLLHFYCGFLLAHFAHIWIWFLLLPIIAGFGKELFDKYIKKSKFDVKDMLVTWAGGVPVVVIIILKLWK